MPSYQQTEGLTPLCISSEAITRRPDEDGLLAPKDV